MFVRFIGQAQHSTTMVPSRLQRQGTEHKSSSVAFVNAIPHSLGTGQSKGKSALTQETFSISPVVKASTLSWAEKTHADPKVFRSLSVSSSK